MSYHYFFRGVSLTLLVVTVALGQAARAGDLGACCYEDGTCHLSTFEMCPSLVGDANCDGAINFDDINPFVEVLSGGTVPDCRPGNCDINRDGAVTFDDINSFVALLSSQELVHAQFMGVATTCADCPPRLGDTCANPFLATEPLPFSVIGNTCSFANDYDEMCPYDSMARDVVYRFRPSQDITVDISVCLDSTDYDTKLYVYADACPSAYIACNDDGCSTPTYPDPYLSKMKNVALLGGHTYFIVVDGYGTQCGTYQLEIRESPVCDVPCPPGAVQEDEACQGDTNGGCGSDPPVFGHIACGQTLCGTSYFDGAYWDTDWFLIDLPVGYANYIFTLRGQAEFEMQLLLIRDAEANCDVLTLVGGPADACEIKEVTFDCTTASSTYYAWIGPQLTTVFDCTAGQGDYWIEVACIGCDIWTGACCRSGLCVPNMTPSACDAFGGVWQGPATGCDPNPCPPPPPGETCANPLVIPALLPFSTIGDTCLYADDYDAVCPYSAPGAPDVVYWFVPTMDEFVDITLCLDETNFDTKLYVFEDDCIGAPIACNDDFCATAGYPENPYVSRLENVLLYTGHDYFIVVDGYGSACGVYRLIVTPPPQ